MIKTDVAATAARTQQPAGLSRLLPLGTIAGPAVLTAAWIILGLMRPATLDAWGVSGGVRGMTTQPFSGLGIGTNAFLFNCAFVLSGLLLAAGVSGVFRTIEANGRPTSRRLCGWLLALSGLGMIVCGIFTLQSFMLHMLGFLLGCFTPCVSFFVTGRFLRRIPSWRRFGGWLMVGSPLTLVLLVAYFLTFDQATMAAGMGVAGLTERVLVLEVFGWFAALGWLAYQREGRRA